MNTNNSTVENNKLIAEFLGFETYEANGYINVHYSDNNVRTLQDTHYQTDWNWLMEVVEKIESLKNNYFIFDISTFNVDIFCLNTDNTIIRVRGHFSKLNNGKELNKIEATYKACILFIKWYNENK